MHMLHLSVVMTLYGMQAKPTSNKQYTALNSLNMPRAFLSVVGRHTT